jgi:transposase
MEGFTGTSVHDELASYRSYPACTHGSCNAHHLRELQYQEEHKKQVWAKQLAQLLLEIKQTVAQAKVAGQSRLTDEVKKPLLHRYEDLLQQGYTANPADPPPEHPKPGRVKQSKARNLLDRLSNQEDVLRFLHDFSVPFDNNLAERDLRMVKVQQKVSGCFRSELGAHAFARIRGYLSTFRKQALPVLSALEMALVGHPLLPAL